MKPIQRALISVSDKTGVVEFAKGLQSLGVEILSTGGTARLLRNEGLPIIEVGDYTGYPEMMDGRVKTLHPRIHGGLLGRRGLDDQIMAEHDIPPIDLVAVNLYPFEQTIARADCTFAMAIENIDIGGPTMLRAAAKNHQSVTVIVDAADYATVLNEMRTHGNQVSEATRFLLATKTFEHTARYDGLIANYLGAIKNGQPATAFPRTFNRQFTKIQDLRYGENPHQQAAFYKEAQSASDAIVNARQIQGKELSFNNIVDADTALDCVKQFGDGPACVIVKHANPCGVACAGALPAAYDAAYRCDPESAFGGIIAVNQELDEETARRIIDRQFVEVIIAPDASPAAIAALGGKKNVRLLLCGELQPGTNAALDFKRVSGGLLIQDSDRSLYEQLTVASRNQPNPDIMDDLLFSWKVAKYVKSNAIVYARGRQTVGIGAGQMSRVNSARIATIKAEQAGLKVADSVMASDAFFPFRDGIDAAAEAGIRAIIQPGGSMRDNEVIQAADEHGIAMVFTGMRHFRH